MFSRQLSRKSVRLHYHALKLVYNHPDLSVLVDGISKGISNHMWIVVRVDVVQYAIQLFQMFQ